MALDKVVYTAHATSIGGRPGGTSKTDDGKLTVTMATPPEMGGDGKGTNPEQLFALGYSACFLGAMKYVASQQKKSLPADASVSADVGIGPIPKGFGVQVALNIKVAGWDKAELQALVDAAHVVCPYSNATRGNIDVTLTVV